MWLHPSCDEHVFPSDREFSVSHLRHDVAPVLRRQADQQCDIFFDRDAGLGSKATVKIVCINDQPLPLHETDCEQVASMVSALGQAGAQVDLWLPSTRSGEPPTVERISNYYAVKDSFSVRTFASVFPAPRWLEKSAHAAVCLRALRQTDCHAVYTRNIPMALAALEGTDKPVIYETYRRWTRDYKITRPAFARMVKHPRLAAFVTHSRLAAESYFHLGLPKNRCLIAHNGFDPERMTPVLSQEEARRAVGLPATGPIVTYSGHVTMQKGLGLVLDLAEALPHALFVIVGSQGMGEVEVRAQSLPNVRIVPWLQGKGPIPYLYASDVLLIPPTSGPLEKIGNTVLPIKTFQYLAAGRTIVAPATPDVMEVLEDGRNAVLLAPDQLDEAKRRLGALLADQAQMTRLAQAARSDSERFTWLGRARRFLEFVASSPAAANHKRAAPSP